MSSPSVAYFFRVTWAEQVGVRVTLQERLDHTLSLGTQLDDALMTVVLGLVALGTVEPKLARHLKVTSPHDASLATTHSRDSLEFDQGPDRRS